MLEAEIWTLRQQINVLRRTAPKKLSVCAVDRMIFIGLYRLFPKICDALAIVKPDTLVRWHRAGFLRATADVLTRSVGPHCRRGWIRAPRGRSAGMADLITTGGSCLPGTRHSGSPAVIS